MRLFNTLTRKKEEFKPLNQPIGLYTCGPTVYFYAHIGNLRTYVFEDILKRALLYFGYQVKHVMNITDVGHLTSDADTGEDKVEKAAQETGKSAWEIASFYTDAFLKDIKLLNIIPPDILAKATDHLKEQIALIKALEEKGFAYRTSDGIYFDTSKFKNYGRLTGMNFEKLNKSLKAGARIEWSKEKKNITDFSLWKFSPQNKKRQMEWDSPWGKGFPGWHIECAAINLKYLTQVFENDKFQPEKFQTIDIHTGGIDHIPIHHTNEIAQVEALVNKPFVKYWLHGEFLILKKGRMGKSEGNVILLNDLMKNGFELLAYRYFLLTAHYRRKLEFDFPVLKASQKAYADLKDFVLTIKDQKNPSLNRKNQNLEKYRKDFETAIADDLNTPRALAVFWKLIKDYYRRPEKYNPQDIYHLILDWDKILGLNLEKLTKIIITEKLTKEDKIINIIAFEESLPNEIIELIKEREEKRLNQDFEAADKIRKQIEKEGYYLEDTKLGPKIKKISHYGRR